MRIKTEETNSDAILPKSMYFNILYATFIKCFEKCMDNKLGISEYIDLSKRICTQQGVGKLKPSMATHFKNFLLTSIEFAFNEPPISFTFV